MIKRLIEKVDRAYAGSDWVRLPLRRRAMWAVALSVEVGALLGLVALVLRSVSASIFFAFFWLICSAFFVSLVFRPATAPRTAVRTLWVVLLVGAAAYVVFLVIVLSSR